LDRLIASDDCRAVVAQVVLGMTLERPLAAKSHDGLSLFLGVPAVTANGGKQPLSHRRLDSYDRSCTLSGHL